MKRLLEEILVESTREDVEKEFLYQGFWKNTESKKGGENV